MENTMTQDAKQTELSDVKTTVREKYGQIAQRVAEYRDRLASLVTAALRERNPEPTVEPLSVALLGAAEALGRWWLRTEAMPAADAAELLIRTLEPGLRHS